MATVRTTRLAAATLLLGVALVGVAGLLHPLLDGPGAGQLVIIAATGGWRGIHLALLTGDVLLVAGMIGLALVHAETPGAGAARGGALLFAFGIAVALIQILFMGGAATALADTYVRGEPGLAATQAAFTYDMLHPFAQLAGRTGQGAIGLGVALAAWGVASGAVLPRGVGSVGIGAGVLCALWTVVVPEANPRVMAGVGLAILWLAIAGLALLAPRRA